MNNRTLTSDDVIKLWNNGLVLTADFLDTVTDDGIDTLLDMTRQWVGGLEVCGMETQIGMKRYMI